MLLLRRLNALTSINSTVLQLLHLYCKEHVASYLQDMLSTMRVSKYKFSINEEKSLYSSATVADEQLQMYTVSIEVDLCREKIEYMCNCPAHNYGICIHVTALLYKIIENLEKEICGTEQYTIIHKKQWRMTFADLMDDKWELEKGVFYVIPCLVVENKKLFIELFQARQNKNALSTIRTQLTVLQILESVEQYYHYPSDMPALLRCFSMIDSLSTHKIMVPEELVSHALWVLSKEPYVFWSSTEEPCIINTECSTVTLQPSFVEERVVLSLQLEREHAVPIQLTRDNAILLGSFPMWIAVDNEIYPVRSAVPRSILQNLIEYKTEVSQAEIPLFLEHIWGQLPDSFICKESTLLSHLEHLFKVAYYNPKLYLEEEGSLLIITIENIYETEDISCVIEGPNPSFEIGSYTYNGVTYFIKRDQDAEEKLITTLQEMGFLKRTYSKWFLYSERVIDFLLNSYPTLIQSYSVFGEKRLHKYKICTNIPTVHARVLTKEKTFNVDMYVKYDTENISMESIWQEWIAGKRYIQLKDGSFASLPEEWLSKASSVLELSGIATHSSPQKEFLHHEIGVLEALFEEKTTVQADEFWEQLLSTLKNFQNIDFISQPRGLQASLRSYQKFGISYLAFLSRYGFSGILADEMGLGKTIQTLAFIQHEIECGNTRPNLIVVPTSVLYNWKREAEKFLPHTKSLVIYGVGRDDLFSKIQESQIVFTTYVLLRRDLDIIKKFDFNIMVLDEAQHIKNPNTITTRAVREIRAKMRLCLSGTPIENNLFELWSLFDFLMPNFLGTRSSFQKNIVKPIREGNTEVLEYFKKKVSPFILRRMKIDVAKDLPEKIETITFCSLGEEQQDLYYTLAKQLKKQVLDDVDQKGIGKAQISILDALLKLRQICCHPKLLRLNVPGIQLQNISSSKFETFKELVTTIIESNHRVLVFSQFIQMLHIMRDWFIREKIPYCYLDGTTKDRIHEVDVFNTTASIPVFLISLKAGGVGLNLTSADYVIHYDPWWNPAVESQATDRVHRIGQTKQVFSYKLICQHTVEEKILLLQEQKKDIADSIIPAGALWKSITREDLEMLFEFY